MIMLIIFEKHLVTDMFIFVIPTIYISTTVQYTLYLQYYFCLSSNLSFVLIYQIHHKFT